VWRAARPGWPLYLSLRSEPGTHAVLSATARRQGLETLAARGSAPTLAWELCRTRCGTPPGPAGRHGITEPHTPPMGPECCRVPRGRELALGTGLLPGGPGQTGLGAAARGVLTNRSIALRRAGGLIGLVVFFADESRDSVPHLRRRPVRPLR